MNQATLLLAAATLSLIPATAALAQDKPAEAVTAYADIRYRLELVDQNGLPNDATASTVRIKAGLRTIEWHGFSGLVEVEGIALLGNESFNDTVNGKVAYPVVADRPDVQLNQAYVRWRPDARFDVTAGRQVINLENQRWVGSVGWRQNDQTLDAVRLTARPAKGLGLDYLYSWRVNRVFGPDSAQGIWRNTDVHSVRATYGINGAGTLSVYGLWLDIPASAAMGSQTFGVRIAGERKLGHGASLLYAAEYARQQDQGINPNRFGLDYFLFEPGLKLGGLTLKGGFEQLEGNGTVALQTPLATLHAFNGWADKFLTTPANGLRDVYLDASYKLPGKGPLGGLTVRIKWHDFNSSVGGLDYGREWDASLSLPLGNSISFTAKLARYDANAFATDTTKVWFQFEAKF
ncbi:MAG: hypothetical protein ABL914_09590 [Novosphingobium sp.]|uniref:hypothetical protein n=1 Tax=Novosphingobium sp. TaxID=1874826 RepID=UPI0032BE36EA